MKVIDLVKQSFLKYPTLYAEYPNMEDVKFHVLHHCFIVLGNGYEWAYTKDPKKAGYLTVPNSVNKKGEWERLYDLPYGEKKINIDIEQYFKSPRYQLRKINHEETKRWQKIMNGMISGMSSSEYERPEKTLFIESEFNLLPSKTILPGEKYDKTKEYYLIPIKEKSEKRSPYPNFSKQFSCFYEKGVEYIQDDWRGESINHLEYWMKWFSDPEKIKTYHGYPNKKQNNELLSIIKKEVKKGKKLENVCRDYSLKPFDLNDKESYLQATMKRWQKEEDEIKCFLHETITKLKK